MDLPAPPLADYWPRHRSSAAMTGVAKNALDHTGVRLSNGLIDT
jgi:hypothetical protein